MGISALLAARSAKLSPLGLPAHGSHSHVENTKGAPVKVRPVAF
jgi:hypothetical protein